jgi:hypothetical protein
MSRRVVVIISLLCLLTAGISVPEGVMADSPGTRADGTRTVTLELLTATWCAGCPYADAVADRLLRVFGPDRLSVIQYHVSMSDPMRTNESDARKSVYGNPGLPSLIIDGELKSEEAFSYEEAYQEYFSHVQAGLQVDTPVTLGIESILGGGPVTIKVSMDSSESLAGLDLFLRVVLFENILEEGGAIYNYTVRAYNETAVDFVTFPLTKTFLFTLDGSWITESMGAVAFLQTDADGGVHQSANVMFGEPPVANIADLAGGTVSGELTIEGTCTSGRSLSETFVRVDDGLWVEADGASSWQHVIDTTKLSDGSHSIYAMVYDVAGTYSETDILTVTVKNEEPVPDFGVAILLLVIVSIALVVGGMRRLRN